MAMTLAHQKIKKINKLNYSDFGKIFNIMLKKIKENHGEVLINQRVEFHGFKCR